MGSGLRALCLTVGGTVSPPGQVFGLRLSTGADGLVAGLGPRSSQLEGGLQSGPRQHQCSYGGTSASEWPLPVSVAPGWAPQPPASAGGSPRSAGGSDTGSFQTAASALGPRACEILCGPFESGVSVSHSHLALQKVRPWPSKPNIMGARLPGVGALAWGVWCGAHPLNALWGSCCHYPPVCVLPTCRYASGLYSTPLTCLFVVPSLSR